MKELDFDELDKAVNSLMAGVSKTPPSPDAAEKTLTLDSSEPVPSAPTSDARDTSPARVTPSRPTASSLPASRRAGRFMDVVPAPQKKNELPAQVSRQGVTVEPTVASLEPTPPAPVAPVESPLPVAKPAVEENQPVSAVANEWPDPIEMASKTTSPLPDTPLTSPFLTDAKVEKRPLGANVLNTPEQSDETPLQKEDESPSEPTESSPAADTIKPMLPAELHSDLVAIESDETGAEASAPTKEPGEKEEEIEKVEPWKALDDSKEESSDDTKDTAKPQHTTSSPSVPISIPQQYREEKSTGTKENGAIYDTDSYHQPLAHPKKQKSGWMWVVWILLIIVIGGGGGAALYFLRLV